MKKRAAIFIDRDNTLIHNDGDLGDPDAVQLIPGASHAVREFNKMGYRVIVITNQGGVARGKYTEADVHRVHQKISEIISAQSGGQIDGYYYCPYHPQGIVPKYTREDPLRKPAPGMLLQADKDFGIEFKKSWMIGDAPRDIQAGQAVGTQTILIGKELNHPTQNAQDNNTDFEAKDMLQALKIVQQKDNQ